jgi:hypothetical protein
MVTGIQASPSGVTVRTPTVEFRASQWLWLPVATH